MGPKYEFTNETMTYNGAVLHRIRRLSDGKLGGWIEEENNLGQDGNCWVDGEAKVYNFGCIRGNAYVSENAVIHGGCHVADNAKIYGDAEVHSSSVYGDAEVYGHAKICDSAEVYDSAIVSGNAKISKDSEIYGCAYVAGNAIVDDESKIYDKARVIDNAQIDGSYVYGSALIRGNAYLRGGSRVYDNAQIYDIAWIGSSAHVYGNAKIYGDTTIRGADVYGNAIISGNAKVEWYTEVYENAQISGDAKIRGSNYKNMTKIHGNAKISSGKYTNGDYCGDCNEDNSSNNELKEVIQDFIYKVDGSNKFTIQTEYDSIDEFFNEPATSDIKLDTLIICAVDTKESIIKIQKIEADNKTEFKFIVNIANEDDNIVFGSKIKSQQQFSQLVQQTIDTLKNYPNFYKYADDLENYL